MNIWIKRATEMGAIFAAGDGVICLTQPERHVDLWKEDALGAEKLVQRWRGRPRARQAYALLQIAGGLAVAAMLRGDTRRLGKEEEPTPSPSRKAGRGTA